LNELKLLPEIVVKFATNILLSSSPKPVKGAYSESQYKRYNGESRRKELMSPAAETQSLNASFKGEPYVHHMKLEREDSPFAGLGLKTLYMKECCWMNPWGIVSGINPKAKSIDVYMYHMFTRNTRINNTLKVWLTTEAKHAA
jgi:hypothetical protein